MGKPKSPEPAKASARKTKTSPKKTKSSSEKQKRTFKVASVKVDGKKISLDNGRYTSKSGPISAAKKVASASYRSKKVLSSKPVKVSIVETTQRSNKKAYEYTFKKQKYKEPQGPFNATFKIVKVGSPKKKKTVSKKV
jgi:hypothetical protein